MICRQGGRQGHSISALLAECAPQLPPGHLKQLGAPSGGILGERPWDSLVQATLLRLHCRWTGQGRAKAAPAAAPNYRGCGRMRKPEGAVYQLVTSMPHFAASTAIKPLS